MQSDLSGKAELVEKRERAKPTIVTVGNRQMLSTGRWNDSVVADWVAANGRERWIEIGELAKFAYVQNSLRSKRQARKRLSTLLREFLGRGELLLIEYGSQNGAASAVKLFSNPKSHSESQAVKLRLEKMQQRTDLSADQFKMAMAIWAHIASMEAIADAG